MKTPAKIFISYCHKDRAFLAGLSSHMIGLIRSGLIAKWTDYKIKPGDHLDGSIQEALNNSDIVLLLVSVDFLNSEYCIAKEFQEARNRQLKCDCPRIIPIIVRSCDWLSIEELKDLKALPIDGKPIKSYTDPDKAYLEIIHGIRNIIDENEKNSCGNNEIMIQIPQHFESAFILYNILDECVEEFNRGICFHKYRYEDILYFSADGVKNRWDYRTYHPYRIPNLYQFLRIKKELVKLNWLIDEKIISNGDSKEYHYTLNPDIDMKNALDQIKSIYKFCESDRHYNFN